MSNAPNANIVIMKYALVTGGSSGIGKNIALKIALDHGYHVLVNYLQNQTAADEAVARITESGGSAEVIQFDVTDKNEVESKLNSWAKANNDSPIEVVVNNAGLIKDEMLLFMEEEKWDSVLDV